MDRKRFLTAAVCVLGFVLVGGIGIGSGEQAAPTETKGVTIKPLGAIDLAPEIEGAQGRQFRMRLVTWAPGGVFGLHSHKGPPTRPGFFYVLSGTLISHMGGVAKEYGPGDSWSENSETTNH
jgi:quercetin dioxygenase-like cupin family protein